jgi:hypothetical protein
MQNKIHSFRTTGKQIYDKTEIQTLDRDYNYDDAKIRKMYTLKEYGLPDGWYGGNVQLVCELEDSPVLLFVSTQKGFKVFSTGIKRKDVRGYLETLDIKVLRNLAKIQNIETDPRHSKDKVIDSMCNTME